MTFYSGHVQLTPFNYQFLNNKKPVLHTLADEFSSNENHKITNKYLLWQRMVSSWDV